MLWAYFIRICSNYKRVYAVPYSINSWYLYLMMWLKSDWTRPLFVTGNMYHTWIPSRHMYCMYFIYRGMFPKARQVSTSWINKILICCFIFFSDFCLFADLKLPPRKRQWWENPFLTIFHDNFEILKICSIFGRYAFSESTPRASSPNVLLEWNLACRLILHQNKHAWSWNSTIFSENGRNCKKNNLMQLSLSIFFKFYRALLPLPYHSKLIVVVAMRVTFLQLVKMHIQQCRFILCTSLDKLSYW